MIQLSIITPTYNSVQFIEACIKNVIEQKCDFVEHLIIDAGSIDGTVGIIKQYAEKYSHIKWISEKDSGQSDAMNKGIKLAKGEYIGFLNVDDGYMQFTLTRVLELIKRYKNPVVLVGNCKLIGQDYFVKYINRPQKMQAYHLYSKTEPYPINPSAYFYSKKIHENPNVGYYNQENHYSMDYEFFLKTVLCYSIIYFNEDWGFMLEHPQAKTTQDSDLIAERKEKLFQSYYNIAPSKVKLKAKIYKLYKQIFL